MNRRRAAYNGIPNHNHKHKYTHCSGAAVTWVRGLNRSSRCCRNWARVVGERERANTHEWQARCSELETQLESVHAQLQSLGDAMTTKLALPTFAAVVLQCIGDMKREGEEAGMRWMAETLKAEAQIPVMKSEADGLRAQVRA